MELLITISLIAIISTAFIVLLDPFGQLAKANDAKRKHDLEILKNKLEEYYNDKNCYPRPDQICYNAPKNVCKIGSKIAKSQVCFICGKDSNSPSFLPYLPALPCDPEHPTKDYLYEVEVKAIPPPPWPNSCDESQLEDNFCPQWYRVYAKFSQFGDSDSIMIECLKGGCGINLNEYQVPQSYEGFGYDYGITNGKLNLGKSPVKSCFNVNNVCNSCGATFEECRANPQCPNKVKIYGSGQACCKEHPGTRGC